MNGKSNEQRECYVEESIRDLREGEGSEEWSDTEREVERKSSGDRKSPQALQCLWTHETL